MDENKDIRGKNKESKIVWFIYLAFIVCACVVLVRIVYIKCCFRDSDPYLKYYTARSSKVSVALGFQQGKTGTDKRQHHQL